MSDRWKETFDSIHAQSKLKDRTKEYLAKKVYRKKGSRFFVCHRFAAAAVCLMFAFFSGGYYLYFSPTAFISVDINPSVELGVNRYDQIVSVEGYNDDGQLLADALEIKFMNYLDALEQILSDQTVQAYFSEDGQMSLTVAGENASQCSSILENIQSCVSDRQNIHCHAGSAEEIQAAHTAGMSFGKYRAFLVLQELDPSFTADRASGLSMREIRDLIAQYSNLEQSTPGDSSDVLTECEESEGHRQGQQGQGHRYQRGRHKTQH